MKNVKRAMAIGLAMFAFSMPLTANAAITKTYTIAIGGHL